MSEKPKMNQEQVLAWMSEHHPDLPTEVDRAWVWIVADLRGCGAKRCECDICKSKAGIRESIKSTGFRFKFDGDHELPSGSVSRWAHNCGRPMPRKKGARSGAETGERDRDLSDQELLALLEATP